MTLSEFEDLFYIWTSIAMLGVWIAGLSYVVQGDLVGMPRSTMAALSSATLLNSVLCLGSLSVAVLAVAFGLLS
jgi:hypothetical protein